MNVQKTMEFILDQLARITVVQARADRRLDPRGTAGPKPAEALPHLSSQSPKSMSLNR